jgi:hypothetical protein
MAQSFRSGSFRGELEPTEEPINARNVVIALMAVFIAVSCIILISGVLPASPNVRPLDGYSYSELEVENQLVLDTYGWVNREEGVVAIPVDRALELIAAEGLPTREQAEGQAQP